MRLTRLLLFVATNKDSFSSSFWYATPRWNVCACQILQFNLKFNWLAMLKAENPYWKITFNPFYFEWSDRALPNCLMHSNFGHQCKSVCFFCFYRLETHTVWVCVSLLCRRFRRFIFSSNLLLVEFLQKPLFPKKKERERERHWLVFLKSS